MLDSVDTLIAFALIFAVVSLLITIVVQMVTSLCNLRGKNLAWGIAEAFEAIDPELSAKAGEKGKNLVDRLLMDRLLSDSQLGNRVWRTNAVRADELFDLLHRIATGRKTTTADKSSPKDEIGIKQDVITLLKGVGVPDSVFARTADETKKVEAWLAGISANLTTLPAGTERDKLLKEKEKWEVLLETQIADGKDIAIRWAAQGEAEIQKIYQKFEHWFETGEERSQEWFTLHARIITGILGVGAALFLQLDTIDIYKLVSSNRTVRDSLVAQVKPVIEQGEKILKESSTVMKASLEKLGGVSDSVGGSNQPSVLARDVQIAATDTPEAVKSKIRAAYTNTYLNTFDLALKEVPEQEEAGKHNDYKTKLDAGFKKWCGELTDPGFTKALAKANLLPDSESKKADFRQRVVKVLEVHLLQVLEDFDQATVKEVQDRMKLSSQDWNVLKTSLDKTGFELFPKGGCRWRNEKTTWSTVFGHFMGMLFSALLLSLGAPFWFNTLKSLASLRSSVAENISDKDKAELKNTKADQASKPPPTVG